MKSTSILSAVLSLPLLAHGVAVDTASTPSAEKICQDYSIPLKVNSTVLIASYPQFKDSFDVVNFVNGVSTGVASVPFFSGAKNITGSYSIGATFCTPKWPSKNQKTVLIATHGLGFDRRYWNSEYQAANYSFVDAAITRGYSVLFYDRLGTGTSSKFSGYDEPQSSTQLAILKQLTTVVKAGQYTGTVGRPAKIVQVGHSFGSALAHGLIASAPGLSDGAILTAIGYNATALGAQGNFIEGNAYRIATLQEPGKWAGRGNGYLSSADVYAQAAAFLYSYDKEALWYANSISQPAAAVEFLTVAGLIPDTPPNFTGPVLVIDGEHDLAFTANNCEKYLLHPAKELFYKAKNFKAVCHPDAGHGFNLNYNATGAYNVILNYLKDNL